MHKTMVREEHPHCCPPASIEYRVTCLKCGWHDKFRTEREAKIAGRDHEQRPYPQLTYALRGKP